MDGWNDNNWMNHGGWMEHAGYGMGWGGWISVVVAIGVIALVITVIVVAVRYLTGAQPQRSSTTPGHRRDAEAILAERLARGDIDDAEFRQRMVTLREHR